jgi:hypothetical protein
MNNLVKIFDNNINLIKFLANSATYHKWCYQNGCTTCGARDLRANLIDCAIQKNEDKFHKDIRITFEGKFNHNLLMLFKMPDEEKKVLVDIICNELKSLTKEDINLLNAEFLRFIILEVWRALDNNTKEILKLTEGCEIFHFIKIMERHFNRLN